MLGAPVAPLGSIPIYIDDRVGHDAVYLVDEPAPVFHDPIIGPWSTRRLAEPPRKIAIGSMQAWGAMIAYHLAAAYLPDGVDELLGAKR